MSLSVEIWKKGKIPADRPPDLARRNIPDNTPLFLKVRGGGGVSAIMNTKKRIENPTLSASDCLTATFTTEQAPIISVTDGTIPKGSVSAVVVSIIKDNVIKVTGWFDDFSLHQPHEGI